MTSCEITKNEAKKFMLLKQGLLGEHKFHGVAGILDFIEQAGCIQYDPIDVCGKSAEILLFSRVSDFHKADLEKLLYRDRVLFDYFDKNMSIMRIEDWKHCGRIRQFYKEQVHSKQLIEPHVDKVLDTLDKRPFASSKDLEMNQKIDWYWSETKISRAVLEALYFMGDLVVHHKKGTQKYYARAYRLLPPEILDAQDPHTEEDHLKWRILRRISAVGMLWNKSSDAFLNILNLGRQNREAAFQNLYEAGEIVKIQIEKMTESFYCLKEDMPLLKEAAEGGCRTPERIEFLAPLDSFLWDRKLIKKLFDFEYKWEIYTPIKDRKYGYYVLPILYGDSLIGRIEIVCNRRAKVMNVNNIWYEQNFQDAQRIEDLLHQKLSRFAAFNACALGAISKI